ncbi:MAG: DUF2306 domain-containing protein [Saprospiraceae bacterium]|nr:DUF2306 domain-containing protein [Saprospiraceae bacterium]
MLQITLQYIPINTDVAFLRIKQDYVPMWHYRLAFFAHAFSAIFVLPAGFTQFSGKLRRTYPAVHRIMGWVYVGTTLLLAAPTGFVIGLYANGGLSSQIAFCLLAILWLYFTAMSVVSIKKKDFLAHERWMVRSFALALSAITLRAWKYVLVALFHPKPMDVYIVVAWLGWVLNLIVAEFIIYKKST